MAEAMLGADLGSLAALSTTMGAMANTIGDVATDTGSTAHTVAGEMTATFGAAMARIDDTMQTLEAAVQSAVGEAESAIWTGANHQVFLQATADFHQASTLIRETTVSAYAAFDQQVAHVTAMVEEFQVGLVSSLGQAAESTTAMANAVTAQADALDQTMNTGYSFSS